MQPSELNDQPHPPGWMLSVEDQPHLCSLPLHPNQIGDLLQIQSWMPVIANGLRAAHQDNSKPPQSFAELQVLPAIQTETRIKQASLLKQLPINRHVAGGEIGKGIILKLVWFAAGILEICGVYDGPIGETEAIAAPLPLAL